MFNKAISRMLKLEAFTNLYTLVITTNVVMVVDIIINHTPLNFLIFGLTTLGTIVIIWWCDSDRLLNLCKRLNQHKI